MDNILETLGIGLLELVEQSNAGLHEEADK